MKWRVLFIINHILFIEKVEYFTILLSNTDFSMNNGDSDLRCPITYIICYVICNIVTSNLNFCSCFTSYAVYCFKKREFLII